jgi:hypothetical protein
MSEGDAQPNRGAASSATTKLSSNRQFQLNMARGLFRLWLVAAVLWAAFWLVVVIFDNHRQDALYLGFALVPPAVIFIIGLMLRWAFKGFSRHD